jgi:hypothetical protein
MNEHCFVVAPSVLFVSVVCDEIMTGEEPDLTNVQFLILDSHPRGALWSELLLG